MQATAKDLRFHSKELLQSVARGEEVVISFHGKPCARLVPFDAKKAKASKTGSKQSAIFGMWKDRAEMSDVNAYMRKLREGRY